MAQSLNLTPEISMWGPRKRLSSKVQTDKRMAKQYQAAKREVSLKTRTWGPLLYVLVRTTENEELKWGAAGEVEIAGLNFGISK